MWMHAVTPCLMYMIAGSSQVEITTNPSPLDRAEVCPGGIVELRCIARNISTDVLRWFLCDEVCRDYATKILNSDGSPVVIVLPLVPGISITLDNSSHHENPRYVSFVSTMTVNVSEFMAHSRRVPTFKCGAFSKESNAVSLNFTVIGKNDHCHFSSYSYRGPVVGLSTS